MQAEGARDLLIRLNEVHPRPQHLLERGKRAGYDGTGSIDPEQAGTPFVAFAGTLQFAAVLYKNRRPMAVAGMQQQPADNPSALFQRARGKDELCVKEDASLVKKRQK